MDINLKSQINALLSQIISNLDAITDENLFEKTEKIIQNQNELAKIMEIIAPVTSPEAKIQFLSNFFPSQAKLILEKTDNIIRLINTELKKIAFDLSGVNNKKRLTNYRV